MTVVSALLRHFRLLHWTQGRHFLCTLHSFAGSISQLLRWLTLSGVHENNNSARQLIKASIADVAAMLQTRPHPPTSAEATVSALQKPGLEPEQLAQHFHFTAAFGLGKEAEQPAPQNKTAVIVPPLSWHILVFVLALKKQKISMQSDKIQVFRPRRPRDLSCRDSHKAEVWEGRLEGGRSADPRTRASFSWTRKLMTHSSLMPPCKLWFLPGTQQCLYYCHFRVGFAGLQSNINTIAKKAQNCAHTERSFGKMYKIVR